MPTRRQLRTNFSAGEVSPDLRGRIDTQAYENGMETMTNVQLRNLGGAERRPGLRYTATLPTPSGGAFQLEPFIFNEDQVYIFAFSSTRVDIYDEDGEKVTDITGESWIVTSPKSLRTAQLGDTMFVVEADGTMIPHVIKRTGATTFTSNTITGSIETRDGTSTGTVRLWPTYPHQDPGITINPAATTGTGVTLTSSDDFFVSGMVGDYLKIRHETGSPAVLQPWRWMKVASYVSATEVTVDILDTLDASTATADWEFQAWTGEFGWPRSVTFHEQRLCWGGSESLPTRMFMSKSGGYFNYEVLEGDDDESIQYDIASDRLSPITNLISLDDLLIFTQHAEFWASSTPEKPLTPSNMNAKHAGRVGSNGTIPQFLGNSVYYVSRTGRTVREMRYDDSLETYDPLNISLLSEHFWQTDTIVDMATQTEGTYSPEQYAYVVSTGGKCHQLLALPDEQVNGWVEWTTQGTFEAVCSINNKVFFAVARGELPNPTVWTMERVDPRFTLDCAIRDTNALGATSWPALAAHLASETVEVNVSLDVKTITTPLASRMDYNLGTALLNGSGDLTTTETVKTVEVGYDYDGTLETLATEVQMADGPSPGEKRHVIRTVVDLKDTRSLLVDGKEVVLYVSPFDPSDTQPSVDGRREFWLAGWDDFGKVLLTQSKPLHFHVLNMVVEVEW